MTDPVAPKTPSEYADSILDILKGITTASGPQAIEKAGLAASLGLLLIGIHLGRAVDIAEKKWGGVKDVAKTQAGELSPTP